jgi:hypothetical protein
MTQMTPDAVDPSQPDNKGSGAAPLTIDPLLFFQSASGCAELWQELVGRSITHRTFGPGTITRIDGDYISINLPQRLGKKQLTEFTRDAFRQGYFSDLQIDTAVEQKLRAAVLAQQEEPEPTAPSVAAPASGPVKKKRAPARSKKKAAA